MKFRVLTLAFLALASVCFSGAAYCQESDEPAGDQNRASVMLNWYPQDGACTAANSKSIKLQDLLADTSVHGGTCVKTSGYISGRALFYRKGDTRREYASSNEKSKKRRLGIYAKDEVWNRADELENRKVTVIGMIGDCSEFYAEDYMMVFGYCHQSGGPIIGLTSIDD